MSEAHGDREPCYNRGRSSSKTPGGERRETCILAEIVPVVDARRICLVAALFTALFALAVPAALGQSASDRKADLDRRISGLRQDIADAKRKEGALTSDIEAANQRIDALGGDIGSLTALIDDLQSELDAHRGRLEQLKEKVEDQTAGIIHLESEFAIAQARLEERLIELYQSEDTDAFGILLQVQSLGDLVDQFEYFESIGRQDQAIAEQIQTLRDELRVAREQTRLTKVEVADETQVLARKTAEQVAAREALVARQNALAAAQGQPRERPRLGPVEPPPGRGRRRGHGRREREARGADSGLERWLGRGLDRRRIVVERLHLAGQRSRDERLRLAVGAHARRNRHRGAVRERPFAPRLQGGSSSPAS